MKQAAKTKRHNSYFRTASDGRLIIDIEDDDNQEQEHESDDDINREDLKDLMETLSLSQRGKNKRKLNFDNEDDDDYQLNDKKSQSFHSKYRSNCNKLHASFLQICLIY